MYSLCNRAYLIPTRKNAAPVICTEDSSGVTLKTMPCPGVLNHDNQNRFRDVVLNSAGNFLLYPSFRRACKSRSLLIPICETAGVRLRRAWWEQLSTPPPGWHYVVIGDRLCVVDRVWRIHESYHFQH